jgi:hypothetical protein
LSRGKPRGIKPDFANKRVLIGLDVRVEDIVFFGEIRGARLKKRPALPNGIPSAGTILRVLGRIDQRKFEECFHSRTRGCFKERMRTGSVTALDGKTVRGSGSGEPSIV